MGYIKLKADGLFTGRELLNNNEVLVLQPDGRVEAIVAQQDAGPDVQTLDGWLSPGFVNCHCHLELSHMKGLIPEHTGLVDFVTAVMQQRHFAPEEIEEAIHLAEEEMLLNGIVAVGDICNTAHTLQQKSRQRLHYHSFVEVSGFVPAFAAARFNQAQEVYRQLAGLQQNTAIHRVTMAPHAPYSVSPQLFGLINEHSAGQTITLHNQETPEEDLFYLTGQSRFRELFARLGVDLSFYQPPGTTSLQACLSLLNKTARLLLVHNTCTTPADVTFARQTGGPALSWCLCIQANQYIENAVPPVDLLRHNNCHLVLGTDSLASNHQLSLLAEMQTLQQHFPQLPLQEILQWATLNGAEALGMQQVLGSFDKGKQPGVIQVKGIGNEKLLPGAAVVRVV
jgi:cytosine/adenosine deaminase-related metal-dependent hydrolase